EGDGNARLLQRCSRPSPTRPAPEASSGSCCNSTMPAGTARKISPFWEASGRSNPTAPSRNLTVAGTTIGGQNPLYELITRKSYNERYMDSSATLRFPAGKGVCREYVCMFGEHVRRFGRWQCVLGLGSARSSSRRRHARPDFREWRIFWLAAMAPECSESLRGTEQWPPQFCCLSGGPLGFEACSPSNRTGVCKPAGLLRRSESHLRKRRIDHRHHMVLRHSSAHTRIAHNWLGLHGNCAT